mmetsp:Transcript_15484/g.16070  ORF Transcript_15484/g.16070 Transcript_15484/m.16070 type:complete len:120 (+) Transcript_15484:12-371(+)
MKILIVEDDLVCMNALINFCKKVGVDYDCAVNGVEAVEFCKKEIPYDLIIMNLYMPEMNGDLATNNIRTLPHGSSYSIILFTGDGEYKEEDLKKNGFDGLIVKPLRRKGFEELIERYKK